MEKGTEKRENIEALYERLIISRKTHYESLRKNKKILIILNHYLKII